MKLIVTVNGKEYEVEVEVIDEGVFKSNTSTPLIEKEKGAAKTKVAQDVCSTSYCKTRSLQTQRQPRPIATSDRGLHAPVVGIVSEINCKEGQKLKYGDPILILEAMKMQNILIAERDGIVKKINIAKGDTVKQGDILIEY